MNICGHWLHVGNEGQQGGSSNVHRDPGDCEAASRRAAALLLSFYGPLKESRNSDAVVTERCSIVDCARTASHRATPVTMLLRVRALLHEQRAGTRGELLLVHHILTREHK